MTAPGRRTAAPRGGTDADRETRIGIGPLELRRTPWPPVAAGPRGEYAVRNGCAQTVTFS